MTTPRVSVVIPTFNRRNDLDECIKSLLDMEAPGPEIIIVDSSSKDGASDFQQIYPVRYLSMPHRNIVHARNLGISKARGDVVAFLDDDTVVNRSWVRCLMEPYVDPRVGGVGGRVIPYGKPRHYYRKIRHYSTGKILKDGLVLGNFDNPAGPLGVDHLPGCNMSFRREALVQAGGFDEHFQGNCFREDTDICVRVRKLGYNIVYQPRALVWHKYRGRSRDTGWVYWYVRNNTYFYFKNIFPQARWLLPLFLYRQAFPPKDYLKKSGVRIGFRPRAIMLAVKGLVNAISVITEVSYSEVKSSNPGHSSPD